MDHFSVEPEDVQKSTLRLRGDEHKHLSRVLRKNVGDEIMATDGMGLSFLLSIRSVGREVTECEILETHPNLNEPLVEITLAVSLLRNPARFDFLVEKVTELGVRRIIPIQCERTIPRHEKHLRLEKIALAAMKQSGRSYLPSISSLTEFHTLLTASESYSFRLMPDERAPVEDSLGTVFRSHETIKSVLAIIGPEGGFTEQEVELAKEAGFTIISLGSRRLRTETAAISLAAGIFQIYQA
ncbi:MAG: RsmE family RNA methyltransferase [bacterium]